ncbi:MAG: HAMP domain-containing histidine kinase [Propionibacteriaceae bacterium]|nr:HAMP domain-containing histidine kinase [Propionibacteriaceae bacterium]
MNKTVGWWAVKIAAALIGYVGALSAVRSMSVSFRYYSGMQMGSWWYIPGLLGPVLAVSGLALLVFAVVKAPHERTPVWRGVDLLVWLVLTYCACFICFYYAIVWYSVFSRQLLIFSLIAYGCAMLFVAELMARVRDRRLGVYWVQFINQFPMNRLISILMTVLMVGNLVWILVFWPIGMARGQGSQIGVLLCTVFTVVALTYAMFFMVSLSAEYDKANADKIKAERFKAELITNVSHDIRTPLTSVINYADLLKGLPVDLPQFSQYVGVLDNKAARLKTLIDDLMEASRAGSGNVSVQLRSLDVCEMVGQIAGEFDDQFVSHNIALVLRQPDDPVMVLADSRHLWRVLENLLGNAVKYTQPGTRVFAQVAVEGQACVLTVANTSKNPIDLADDELTEQFIRGDRARNTEGNGLGLYIAKSLVEVMGGRLSIRVSGDQFKVEVRLVRSGAMEPGTVDVL